MKYKKFNFCRVIRHCLAMIIHEFIRNIIIIFLLNYMRDPLGYLITTSWSFKCFSYHLRSLNYLIVLN